MQFYVIPRTQFTSYQDPFTSYPDQHLQVKMIADLGQQLHTGQGDSKLWSSITHRSKWPQTIVNSYIQVKGKAHHGLQFHKGQGDNTIFKSYIQVKVTARHDQQLHTGLSDSRPCQLLHTGQDAIVNSYIQVWVTADHSKQLHTGQGDSKPWSTVAYRSRLQDTMVICLFVLKFYGQVNQMGSCRAQSLYLTILSLGRLSPLSGSPIFVHILLLETDNCPSSICGRKRMTIEYFMVKLCAWCI